MAVLEEKVLPLAPEVLSSSIPVTLGTAQEPAESLNVLFYKMEVTPPSEGEL